MSGIDTYPGDEFPGLDVLEEVDLGRNERKFTPLDRYKYSLLTHDDGRRYFSKKLPGIYPEADAVWSHFLARESVWAQFAHEAGVLNPELQFDALMPVHIAKDAEGHVTQLVYPFIEAPFVAEPRDSTNMRDVTTIDRYCKILLSLDTFSEGWRPPVDFDNSDEHTPYNQMDKSWEQWVESADLIGGGYLTRDMLDRASALVAEGASFVTPRMQHGDLTPWHFFNIEDSSKGSTWVSFDGEHASILKPRFYDLAYTYSRLFTTAKDPVAAEMLLGHFIELGSSSGLLDRDEFERSFIPVLTSRSIGMFLDAHNDHGSVDYHAEASELFRRCMTRNMDDLTA